MTTRKQLMILQRKYTACLPKMNKNGLSHPFRNMMNCSYDHSLSKVFFFMFGIALHVGGTLT